MNLSWLSNYIKNGYDRSGYKAEVIELGAPAFTKKEKFYINLFKKLQSLIGYKDTKPYEDPDYRNWRLYPLRSNIPGMDDRYFVCIYWADPDSVQSITNQDMSYSYMLRQLELKIYDKKYDITIGEMKFYTQPEQIVLMLNQERGPMAKEDDPWFKKADPLGLSLLSGVINHLDRYSPFNE